MALSEDVSYLVHTVDNDLISIGDLKTDDSEAIESLSFFTQMKRSARDVCTFFNVH